MRSIWERATAIPRGPAGVLASLAFDIGSSKHLASLDDEDWRQAFAYSDRAQLTLLLARGDMRPLPQWVRERIERNLADNCERTARMLDAYCEAADALQRAGIEFAVLKGFGHVPGSVPDERLRVQYDIDLYCLERDLNGMRDVLLALGYRPGGKESDRVDHLPTMVRGGAWQWNGNYFDPDMPIAIEPHFRLWDPETERFEAPGVEQFWPRRSATRRDGLVVPALDPADALGYAALHALRHWLRGSLKALHLYEIAFFLHARAADDAFWCGWRKAHPAPLRRLEALTFRLACEWFGCDAPPLVHDEMHGFPTGVQTWFERFSASPVEALYRPNKAELWLHWRLLDSAVDRLRVARRRVLPARLPAAEEARSPGTVRTPAMRVRTGLAYAAQLCRRATFHLRAFAPTVWQAMTWNSAVASLGKPFWTFLAGACLFNFGMFVFMLLYNLRLLDLGYRENALGWITTAMTAGSIAGALPAGALIARLQLRRALLACFAGVAALSALRSVATGLPALLGTAFAAGMFLSLWAVSIPPAVAQLTNDRTRPRAFSLVFATGIGIGVLGGLAGGKLASLLGKELALLCGCAAMLLAILPVSRLPLSANLPATRVQFPRNGFMLRFLTVIALWTVAVGSFNPFFNAFFATQLGAGPESIGLVFSGAQLAQVGALLLAPVVLRALGSTRAVVAMQLAAGTALAALPRAPGFRAAACAYAIYMSFQYMSEPGLYSLLMRNVRPEQQTGASSLNFLVVFSAQAFAATLAGAAIAIYGYSPVMSAAGALACATGLLFAVLIRSAREEASAAAPVPQAGAASR
jgi:predicted MFS family arabinose efflux permease